MTRIVRSVVTIACVLGGGFERAGAQTMERVSVDSSGAAGNSFSDLSSLSADGRFIVFHSHSTNLVAGDNNGLPDVFFHDRQTGETRLVSVSSSGAHGNGRSFETRISADGRFITFYSTSTNLVSPPTSGTRDVYVRDMATGVTTLVSSSATGVRGDGPSDNPYISADGRFVAFASLATNLVPGDTNGVKDVFVRDLATGTTARVSVDSFGTQSTGDTSEQPSISADGRFVAFISAAPNLDPADTNGTADVFVHDSMTGATERVSVNSAGEGANGTCLVTALTYTAVSADGRYVVFSSRASNLATGDTNGTADVFVRDRYFGTTTRVSVDSAGGQGNGDCVHPAISQDGRFVAYATSANNLVAGDSNAAEDVFVCDRSTGIARRVSASVGGTQGDSFSNAPCMSANGELVGFTSSASTLVPGGSTGSWQVYVTNWTTITLNSVTPNTGSLLGGDLVHLQATGSATLHDPIVLFGDSSASIVAVLPDRVDVRTPAGTGSVDVTIRAAEGVAVLRSAFSYVEPTFFARVGNVNEGIGDREDVLLVNSQRGEDYTRTVALGVGQSISVVMLSPSSRPSAPFVLYAWIGVPNAHSLQFLRRGLGTMVFPPPFGAGNPQPSAIWNNAGYVLTLGAPTLASRPAPSIVFRRASGSPHPVVLALQGLIADRGSQHSSGWSVTNAVVLRIR
ncbi:MAG: PD40 domain-containing protein [Planctomycetes bacterium]|nr:PD40 domain-containing protein [Planctomycetota bacterium]